MASTQLSAAEGCGGCSRGRPRHLPLLLGCGSLETETQGDRGFLVEVVTFRKLGTCPFFLACWERSQL